MSAAFAILIDTALKGLIFIAAAAIASYALRNRSAAARHAVWTAAVIGHLALPVASLIVPQWRLPLLPTPTWLNVETPSSPAAAGITSTSSETTVAAPEIIEPESAPAVLQSPVAQPERGKWPASSILGMLWLLGSALILLRLAIGTWRVGRLAKFGDRVDDGEWLSLTQRVASRIGITRPLTLLRGDSVTIPVTWGVIYPAVLLPPEANDWPEARRRFVLVHEMAHVKRFDALTQLIAQITVAILWFNPFLWYAAHRMRVEREHACDDYVIRDGTVPSLYAGELLEMVQSIGSQNRGSAVPAFAALAMARRSEFEGRMLAILDSRQERKSLDRKTALAASVALVLFVLPLAALRPFEPTPAIPVVAQIPVAVPAAATKTNTGHNPLSEIACDSVMSIPVTADNSTRWTHLHSLTDDSGNNKILEFLSYRPGRCAQAIVSGPGTYASDQLSSLPPGSHAYLREISGTQNRLVRIEAASDGAMIYTASVGGESAAYDAAAQRWVARLLPEALKEAAINAPARVTLWLSTGGVDGVLSEITRINNSSSKRIHYQALIERKQLTPKDAEAVRTHALRSLSGSSSDLKAVLATMSKGTSSASLMSQYGAVNDPTMILMALQGAKEISSDTDRLTLLSTIAPKALGKKNATLRRAYFEATAQMTSDTDLKGALIAALQHGNGEPEITLAVFKAVGTQMTSDTDKRTTLATVVERRLLKTSGLREAFMVAARTIESSTDFTALMEAALK